MNWGKRISTWRRALANNQVIDLFPLRYSLKRATAGSLRDDVRAGLNVSLLAFPQCMAYSLIAGVPVRYGILCFIAASLIGSLFGSSKLNSYGPSNATSVLVLSLFLALQIPAEEQLVALPVMVLLAGLFLILGSLLRVASLIQYVSRTVITGYITAAALLIIANQIKNAMGFSIPKVSSFIGVIRETVLAAGAIHWPSLALSLLTAAVYLGLRRYPVLPGVALTLALMTGLSTVANHYGLSIATLDALHMESFSWALPALSMDRMSQFATASLTLAFLITLEAGSIGKSLAARTGDRMDANQEMFGLGMANAASALFGGMAASASLTRSSLNGQSGAKSPICNIFAAAFVAVLLYTLAFAIGYIPQPALAVVVIMIGVSLLNKRHILIVSRATRSDRLVFYVTLIAGLLLALDVAIYLGTALSILLFLNKVARPEMVEYAFNEHGHLAEIEARTREKQDAVSIVHVEGELFFGAAEVFRDQIRRICEDPNLTIVILKLRNAHNMDATSVMALEELIRYTNERNRHLILSETRKDILRVLKNSGMIEVIGRKNIFTDNPQNPTLSTAKALRRAKEILGGKEANVSIYVDPQRDRAKRSPA